MDPLIDRSQPALGRGMMRALLVALLLAMAAGGAIAESDADHEAELDKLVVDSAEYDYQPQPLYPEGTPVRRLTVDESLALAVKNNLGVQVARFTPFIAEQEQEGSWGAYDPNLEADIGQFKQETPRTSGLNNVNKPQSRGTDGGARLSTLLPYIGATIGVSLESGKTVQNAVFARYSQQYDSAIFLEASVPLLKGLIWNQAWTNVKVSKLRYGRSLEEFRVQVMDVARETINAYWLLVATADQYRVSRKSLETARALLDQTRTEYEVGVKSKVDVVEAEAGVADREFRAIQARNRFDNAEDVLINAVLGTELAAVTPFRVRAIDDPADYTVRKVDVSEAVDTAFANVPDLRIKDTEIDEQEVQLRFAKNSMLPQLDITARYGFVNQSGKDNNRACGTGFGGDPATCEAALKTTGYGRSYDDMFRDKGNENYDFRAVFSVPIPNTTARRNVTAQKIGLQRTKTDRVRLEQDIIVAVRSAARGLIDSAEGIEAAERRRLAAEEQLRAERIRLEHGESTPFDVLQRESDLVEAESQKIAALQLYREAEATLERVQGTILKTYSIQIDDVRNAGMR